MFSSLKKLIQSAFHRCPCEEDLFDFALDGLDHNTRAKVREHLSSCPPCREQVKDYAWVSEGIALTAPQVEAPEGMCSRVLDRIRKEGAASLERAVHPAPVSAPAIALQPRLDGWALFWMRLGPVFALLSLTMSLVALGALSRQSGGLNTASAHAGTPGAASASAILADASSLLNSPKVQRVALSGTRSGQPCSGEIVFAEGMDRLLVKVDNLKPCSRGRVYTVWMCQGKDSQACRLAGFQTEGAQASSYLLPLAKPLVTHGKPVTFKITLEESGKDPSQLKGPEHLGGRFEL